MACLIAASIVLGQAQRTVTRFDSRVREDFFAGITGDSVRFERAMTTCEETLAKDPKNAAAMVWHGAGVYVRAGIAFRNGDNVAGKELKKLGIQEMADAVALDPESVQTRIPRAAIFLSAATHVSDDIMKPLLEIAVGDYEKVMQLEAPYFDTVGTHGRGELLGGLADGYRRLGNVDKSRKLLERIVKDVPGTPYEVQAKRWLADLSKVGKQEQFCIGCHTEKNP
jgi:hypothetical protein